MGELARIEEAAGLTAMQSRFVDAMLAGEEADAARTLAGYSETTLPAHILSSQAVQAALNAWCAARMRGDLKLKALKTLEELMKTGPAATRFNAAKLILEADEDSDRKDDRPLSERPTSELEAMIDKLEGERMARMKDVTPQNGA